MLPGIWWHVGVDTFLSCLPLDDEGRQAELIEQWPVVAKGIHGAMAAIVEAGNRLIIDHVLSLPGSSDDLRTA